MEEKQIEIDLEKLKIPALKKCKEGSAEIIIGNKRLWVFINGATGQLDVTVDTIGPKGYYDLNIEWESCSMEGEPIDDSAYILARSTILQLKKESKQR
jgi:hypothetical protein